MSSGICSIYKITNQINGKIYVGQTWQAPLVRFKAHCKPHKDNLYFNRAIQKYGKENFFLETICYAIDRKDADFWESHFIIKFDSKNRDKGYNLTDGGRKRTTHGYRHTDASKDILRSIRLGSKHTDETKMQMSLSRIGRKHSEETKKNMSDIKKLYWSNKKLENL